MAALPGSTLTSYDCGIDVARLFLKEKADITFTGFLTGDRKDAFLASVERFAFPALAADGDVEGRAGTAADDDGTSPAKL